MTAVLGKPFIQSYRALPASLRPPVPCKFPEAGKDKVKARAEMLSAAPQKDTSSACMQKQETQPSTGPHHCLRDSIKFCMYKHAQVWTGVNVCRTQGAGEVTEAFCPLPSSSLVRTAPQTHLLSFPGGTEHSLGAPFISNVWSPTQRMK